MGLGDLWPGVVKKRTVKSDNRKIKGENSFWSLNAARVPKILNYRTTSGWPLAVFAASAAAFAAASAVLVSVSVLIYFMRNAERTNRSICMRSRSPCVFLSHFLQCLKIANFFVCLDSFSFSISIACFIFIDLHILKAIGMLERPTTVRWRWQPSSGHLRKLWQVLSCAGL